MAKVGYSFNGGRKTVKQRRKSSRVRYLVIFIMIIIFCSGIYFMFMRSDKPIPFIQANKPSAINIPSAKEKIKIAELITPKVKQSPKVNQKTPTSPALSAIDIVPQHEISATVNEFCQKSTTALNKHEYVQARQLALLALKQPGVTEYSAGWLKAAEALSRANSLIINSDVPLPGKKESYKVQQGDFLQKIANKFNTTVELIQRGNNIKKTSNIVYEGQILKIYRGKWKIIISKKHRLLSLYDGDELFKIYHVCIGRQNRTPECEFMVVAKKKNPAWYKSKNEIIPFGTKANVLGTRWIALQATDEKFKHLTGYGIHGTWDNDSIGKAKSNGCIRMRNADVEELFSIIPDRMACHTQVVITK